MNSPTMEFIWVTRFASLGAASVQASCAYQIIFSAPKIIQCIRFGTEPPCKNIGRVYITPGTSDIGCGDGTDRIASWNTRFPRALLPQARYLPK